MTEENKENKETEGKEQYQELKERYSLPELKELDKEFHIGHLEKDEFLLRTVTNKMSDRLEHYMKILHEIIQPDQTLNNLYETEAFDEKEKNKIFELFKKIAHQQKKLFLIDITHNEEQAAEIIKKTYEFWKSIKEEFVNIVKKTKDVWNQEGKKSKKMEGYFG